MRCMRAWTRSRRCASSVDALLVRAGALALGDEVRGQLVLELAQLLGDGDEADQQADGGNRELAGAQRQARPPGALEELRGATT